jgi:hypothetical protein
VLQQFSITHRQVEWEHQSDRGSDLSVKGIKLRAKALKARSPAGIWNYMDGPFHRGDEQGWFKGTATSTARLD